MNRNGHKNVSFGVAMMNIVDVVIDVPCLCRRLSYYFQNLADFGIVVDRRDPETAAPIP